MPGNGKPPLPSTSPANPVGAPNNKNGGGGAVGESKMINGTPQERKPGNNDQQKPGVIGVSTAKVGKQGKKAGDTLDETQVSCGPSSKKKKVRLFVLAPEGFIFFADYVINFVMQLQISEAITRKEEWRQESEW